MKNVLLMSLIAFGSLSVIGCNKSDDQKAMLANRCLQIPQCVYGAAEELRNRGYGNYQAVTCPDGTTRMRPPTAGPGDVCAGSGLPASVASIPNQTMPGAKTASVNSGQVYAQAAENFNKAQAMNNDPNSANAGPAFNKNDLHTSSANSGMIPGQIHPLRKISSVDSAPTEGSSGGSASGGDAVQ